jgi:WhiB family redox-sensing transcriptional regulator
MTFPYIPAQRGAAKASVSWRSRAACGGADPRLFFPVGTTGWGAFTRPDAVAQTDIVVKADNARAVCARCQVRSECLAWALATGCRDGVWGGRLLRSVPRGPGGPGHY